MESGVQFKTDEGLCVVSSMGMEFSLDLINEKVGGLTDSAREFYERHQMFFDHSVIWGAALGKGVGQSGRLIKPSALSGGHHFFTRGTHVLPLDEVAAKFGNDKEAFKEKAEQLGGKPVKYGDAAYEFYPLHGLAVSLILWLGDDEFEPRADLLFDSSAGHVAPLDVLWSAAMLVLEAMLL